ncbi:MAG: MOSC domain-containing protein [Planctomycetes bacterium]|nr:MOSC domain-containing protein [Planctomycetota bacterium]
MDLSFRFDLWYALLPASPKDEGRVVRCVLRPAHDRRETPEAIRVSPERGVEQDRWSNDPEGRPGNQVSLINVHVLRSLAGTEERMPLSGDNLHVDLDLSEENLPVGARLSIGSALLEVSADPHRPCKKFHERFGASAVKKVVRASRRGRRGRGLLATVLRAGEIRTGDAIRVERPAPESST